MKGVFLFFFSFFTKAAQFFKRLKCSVILQNWDDDNRLTRECEGSKFEIILIKGSGAVSKVFCPIPALSNPKSGALVARMVKSKGLDDVVNSAKIIWTFK